MAHRGITGTDIIYVSRYGAGYGITRGNIARSAGIGAFLGPACPCVWGRMTEGIVGMQHEGGLLAFAVFYRVKCNIIVQAHTAPEIIDTNKRFIDGILRNGAGVTGGHIAGPSRTGCIGPQIIGIVLGQHPLPFNGFRVDGIVVIIIVPVGHIIFFAGRKKHADKQGTK
ncbi:MAG: hypothetical protein BWY70_01524 [Bacteroidetes bacterium ADurb.Bin408]|nr:MAG: hypothetical protein BWY70_01524 [Bacteroidetes bacterium ADurb.Bin408]